jgi:hypothetical protein
MRAPLQGEIRVIDVTGTSTQYHVPDGNAAGRGTPDWRGRFVRLMPVGGKLYFAVTTAVGVLTVSETGKSVPTASITVDGVTATRITANASNTECWEVPDGQERDVYIPFEARSWAVKGSAVLVLRTHPSET